MYKRQGTLRVEVAGGTVWMDMAPPKLLQTLPQDALGELYAAYGLTESDRPAELPVEIISTGLADIMMPVRDRETLLRAVQDETAVTALSRRFDVTGVHMFCLGDKTCTAWCSNFAPLYDIPEECATGTSNGALVYYLYRHGLVELDKVYTVVQGEKMGRPSMISAQVILKDGQPFVKVGGPAVTLVRGEIEL